MKIIVFIIFYFSIAYNKKKKLSKIIWDDSINSPEYKEFLNAYPYVESFASSSKKTIKIGFDRKTNVYTIVNVKWKNKIFLASRKSIVEKDLNEQSMIELINFSTNCEPTHLDINLYDSSPNGSGVYLDNSQVGNVIKNGRFNFRTMGICRKTNVNIEVSKSNCQTYHKIFLIPTSGSAQFNESINLDCSKNKRH